MRVACDPALTSKQLLAYDGAVVHGVVPASFCAQDVARTGELQTAAREAVSQGARTIKEKLHTRGRQRKQCQLHLRVSVQTLGEAGSGFRLELQSGSR